MDNPTQNMVTKAVRQILFNELGLSKQYIYDLVDVEVNRAMTKILNDSDRLESIIGEHIRRIGNNLAYTPYHYNGLKEHIKNSVADYVQSEVSEILKNKLEITIKV